MKREIMSSCVIVMYYNLTVSTEAYICNETFLCQCHKQILAHCDSTLEKGTLIGCCKSHD